MMLISSRDIFADLPKNLLKKKMEEIRIRKNVKSVQGYQATVDALPELMELYKAGEIESYPVLVARGEYFEWRRDPNNGSTEHRPNNLPSTEWKSDPDRQYKVNGEHHRTNGPSVIGSESIVWYLDGRRIAKARRNGLYKYGNEQVASHDIYKKLINEKFPSAGDKIEFKDWSND